MKSIKIIGSLLIVLFLIVLSSGYTIQHDYYNDDTRVKTVYYTFDKNYQENEHRYPVSDYKEGYTYRVSKEYLKDRYDSSYERDYSEHSYSRNSYGRSTNKVTYYEYVPYMRGYEEKTCYDRPPRGKLFYIKCDF